MNLPLSVARNRGNAAHVALYVLMLIGTPLALLLIAQLGEGLVAPVATAPIVAAASTKSPHAVMHFLLAMIAIIASARGLGYLFQWLHQPPVIGEVIAGILLGPSLLGMLAPSACEYLFPPSVIPSLTAVAQLGVIFYMFLVGLEFDPALLRQRGHAAAAISHASIVVPLLLGAALALALYPVLSSRDVPFPVFALFMGTSLSVTAFPVLARILTDQNLQKSELGGLALTCAAVDDVTAWCLLALVVGIAQAQISAALSVMLLTALYVAVMLLLVRPLIARFASKAGSAAPGQAIAAALAALFVSAWITEAIGIHAVFGAFLLGAIIPKDSTIAAQLRTKLEDLTAIVLLPAFFALVGTRTQIGLLYGLENWALCAVIIATACLGKFGGSSVAALASGMSWRQSAALGVLMNTRGLMELIVLNIGLDLGVISPRLYALMVVMALVTTLATSPLLRLLGIHSYQSGRLASC